MNTFNNCMIVITNQKKTREQMLSLMDLYVMNNRITAEQYQELVDKMDQVGLE
ncbi:hypothetical protein [Lachnoclostridium phytofermentans]|uniref:hypothetical protein n=1 Tax=Lachnoclostridium phytofermentans TaxID=66219 RepID=UPI0002FF847C|nr:hypothetical protein [Lachnoclostridium phytofermentans]